MYVDALCFSLALVTRSWDGLCRVVCCWLSLYDTLPVVFVVRPLGALFLGDVGCIDSCIFFLSRARSACEDIIRISYFWLWFSLCRVFLLSGDVFFVRFLCCLGDLSHFVVFFIEFVKNRYIIRGIVYILPGILSIALRLGLLSRVFCSFAPSKAEKMNGIEPEHNTKRIMTRRSLLYNSQPLLGVMNKSCEQFGIRISNSQIQTKARVLPPPCIQYNKASQSWLTGQISSHQPPL